MAPLSPSVSFGAILAALVIASSTSVSAEVKSSSPITGAAPFRTERHAFCGTGGPVFCNGVSTFAKSIGSKTHFWVSASAVAQRIVDRRPNQVILSGTSMGCGAARNVAAELDRHGIAVDVLICFDGARVLGTVQPVPCNVKTAYSWRQNTGLGGTYITAACPKKTAVRECTLTDVGHVALSHDPRVHRAARAAIAGKPIACPVVRVAAAPKRADRVDAIQ